MARLFVMRFMVYSLQENGELEPVQEYPSVAEAKAAIRRYQAIDRERRKQS